MGQDKPILLVDDNVAHRKLICRAISKAKIEHPVIEADCLKNARELLFSADKLNLAVAVVDLNLGDGRGTELIDQLKGDEHYAQVPILVLSTSGLDKDIEESYETGADEYVKKSDDLMIFSKEIAESIRRYL